MSTPSAIPTLDSVKNLPANREGLKIVRDRSRLRVVTRDYYWSSEAKRGLEHRRYIGYIVDGTFYANDEYRSKFKRSGVKRLVSKKVVQKQTPSETESATVQELEMPRINPVPALETRLAAEFPIYYAIAEKCGLIADAEKVWGTEWTQAALSIAMHWLHTSANAVYLFESWAEGKLLPFHRPLSSKEISEFFSSLANTPGWRKDFFKARIARLPEDEVLSFDATEIATEAEEISYAQYGKGKEGGYQRQVGLTLLVGHRTGLPVLFRLLPGQIADVSTVPDLLFRFGEITENLKIFASVLDRGYESLDNIARFKDANANVIISLKTDARWVQDAMSKAMTSLWAAECRIAGSDCWGCTIPCKPRFPDGIEREVYVHVYRSDKKSHVEHTAFYEDLEKFEKDWMQWCPTKEDAACPLLKSPLLKFFENLGTPGMTPLKQNFKVIDEETRYYGFFCNVTTMKCSAKDALEAYRTRDLIEKTFKAGKSDVDMDTLRSHRDDTLEGRFIVSFFAMTILAQLRRAMKQTTYVTTAKGARKTVRPLEDEMTFNELKNRLSSIRVVFDGRGNRHWMEVTKRQHEIARRLGFPDVYSGEVPIWAVR